MARVRSTARVTHEGEEAKATETAPISKVMRQSGLVVMEGGIDEGALLVTCSQGFALLLSKLLVVPHNYRNR